MSTTFSRSMRALQRDSFNRTTLVLFGGMLFLLVWGAWLLLSRVGLYETSSSARLEVDRASFALQAPADGRVITANLRMGDLVREGDLLLELDATIERRQLEEEQTRLAGMERQIRALRDEIASRRKGRGENLQAREFAVREAQSRLREAIAAASFAEEQAARFGSIADGGSVSETELHRLNAEAEQRQATVEARRNELARIEGERRTDQSDRQAEIGEQLSEIARLEGEIATSRISAARLGEQIERRMVRAPVDGKLGEAASLKAGSVVHAGDKLAAIVPSGTLRAVAMFDPPSAFGRLRAGQSARIRLAGFPWTQYGALPATVTTVGSEVREGQVRVELQIHPERESRIPLEHGLPGSVEIEVEKVSPATLILRGAGRMIAPSATHQATANADGAAR